MYINVRVIIIKPIKDRRLMHFFLFVGEQLIDLHTSSFIVDVKCCKKINVGHS